MERLGQTGAGSTGIVPVHSTVVPGTARAGSRRRHHDGTAGGCEEEAVLEGLQVAASI